MKTTNTAKGTASAAISSAKAKQKVVDAYAAELEKKMQKGRKIPGFSDYALSGSEILSVKTGKVQQIPAGKKKYLIFNDKGERRSIGLDEIKKLIPAAAAPEKQKAASEKRAQVAVDVEALKRKPVVKTILESGAKKYVLCYKLHTAGFNTDEIMALTDTPYAATKRNIWLFTSGAKKLD